MWIASGQREGRAELVRTIDEIDVVGTYAGFSQRLFVRPGFRQIDMPRSRRFPHRSSGGVGPRPVELISRLPGYMPRLCYRPDLPRRQPTEQTMNRRHPCPTRTIRGCRSTIRSKKRPAGGIAARFHTMRRGLV